MVDGSEVVPANTEEILDRTVYRKETLSLGHGRELPHLSIPARAWCLRRSLLVRGAKTLCRRELQPKSCF